MGHLAESTSHITQSTGNMTVMPLHMWKQSNMLKTPNQGSWKMIDDYLLIHHLNKEKFRSTFNFKRASLQMRLKKTETMSLNLAVLSRTYKLSALHNRHESSEHLQEFLAGQDLHEDKHTGHQVGITWDGWDKLCMPLSPSHPQQHPQNSTRILMRQEEEKVYKMSV